MRATEIPLYGVWVHPISLTRLSEPEFHKMVNRSEYVRRNGYGEGEYVFELIDGEGECVVHLMYDFEAVETFAD